jgi:hypothetical protein
MLNLDFSFKSGKALGFTRICWSAFVYAGDVTARFEK